MEVLKIMDNTINIKSMIAKSKENLSRNCNYKVNYEEILSIYYTALNFCEEKEKEEIIKEFECFLEEVYKHYRYKNLLAQKRISLPFSISLTHKENHEEGKIRCN